MEVTSAAGGTSEQACNECRRRKGRCDRQLPQCTPCSRSNRLCQYHKHSRTPLTRRHLTDVEQHLKHTRQQLLSMQRRALAAEARLQEGGGGGASAGLDWPHNSGLPSSQEGGTPVLPAENGFEERPGTGQSMQASHGGVFERYSSTDHAIQIPSVSDGAAAQQPPSTQQSAQAAMPQQYAEPMAKGLQVVSQPRRKSADSQISDAEDLSWDEQTPHNASTGSMGGNTLEERASVADGMASLSVEAKGSGYLGSASGAAMLRMLLPADQHRRSLKASPRSSDPGHFVTSHAQAPSHGWVPTPVYHERSIGSIDLDAAIDDYFSLYHLSYPIVHSPTFRAQYMQVIARPSGNSWNALAYIIGALGLFTKAPGSDDRDLDLFEAAKANISLESLESGNITLVQVLTLMSNYLQKRNKPNSGYNYLGLALHMAMGIGLHKDFASAKIRPLAIEIRRRVWWTLQVFAVGAMITFGRPLSWPAHGIEAAIPLNIDERDLTHASTTLPPERDGVTSYSSVIWQTRFHLSTNAIYTKVINASFSSVEELLGLDDQHMEPWRQQWSAQVQNPPVKFRTSQSIMEWRFRNFRIIMYRPFVIRRALQSQFTDHEAAQNPAVQLAIDRCVHEARESIHAIRSYWTDGARNRMSAWYALYFLFQASLIPCVLLRNEPGSEQAPDWRAQIRTALDVISEMKEWNPASTEAHQVISKLCAAYLTRPEENQSSADGMLLEPIEESPLTQIDNMYSMMWPGTDILDFGMDAQYGQDNLDFDFAFGPAP